LKTDPSSFTKIRIEMIQWNSQYFTAGAVVTTTGPVTRNSRRHSAARMSMQGAKIAAEDRVGFWSQAACAPLLEDQEQEECQGQPRREQDMDPVQSRILFQPPARKKAKDDENQPQNQHGQHKKRGKDWFDVSRPGIVPKDVQPKEARQGRKSKNASQPGDKKSGQSKEQGIQVSFFHGVPILKPEPAKCHGSKEWFRGIRNLFTIEVTLIRYIISKIIQDVPDRTFSSGPYLGYLCTKRAHLPAVGFYP